MSKETISFRIEADKRAALDKLAEAVGRDRSAVINEALDAHLELHHWQIEHIERGLAEAESGIEGVASKGCPTTKCLSAFGAGSPIACARPKHDHRLATPGRARPPANLRFHPRS